MKKNVFYRKKDDGYFKINHDLKRITKVEKNEVSYLDYDTNIEEINSYKSIAMDVWKHIENSFFISRHFEWEYNGIKYRTTDKPIQWEKGKYGSSESLVFHNGNIWIAHYSGNYFPRIYLERPKFIQPTREVIIGKDVSKTADFKRKETSIPKVNKWTDFKYLKHFEQIN